MRTDISEYLIHFLRTPDNLDLPSQSDGDDDLIAPYYPLIEDNDICDEFHSLKNIIKEGGLRAGLSYRNQKATIYGGDPVVCFTEMPLLNFIQYAKKRNNDTRITNYGIALLKKDVFNYGGRPVISGLSKDNNFYFENESNRIINPAIIPYKEQYRYVMLNLLKGNDWTHEREWRIKCTLNDKVFSIRDDRNFNTHLTWGIPIFSDFSFTETIIIIQNKREALELHPIVQNQLDSGYCRGGEEFCNKIKYLILKDALIYLDNNHLTSIEHLPHSVYYEHEYEEITELEKIKVNNVIEKCRTLSSKFAEEFHSITKLQKGIDGHYCDVGGWANIRSDDTQNKFVRYLIKSGYAKSLGDFVWLEMNSNVPALQCLTYYEYISNKQIEILNQELEIKFVLDSRID